MCKIVKETCEEIWNALMPEYVKAPSSENEWKETSKVNSVSTGICCIFNLAYAFCLGVKRRKVAVICCPKEASSSISCALFC